MSSRSRQQLEAWLKTIDVNGAVLDVGGSQNPIKGRTKNWNVDDYKILDLEIPHENKTNPDIRHNINYHLTDNRDYLVKEKFWSADIVFAIEIMEYVRDPATAINNISLLLKRNGLLYSSWHALYGLHNPKGEDCLRYTRYGIEKLMKVADFEILEMIPRTISEEGKKHLINFYKTEGMRLDYNDPETYVEGYLVKARKK